MTTESTPKSGRQGITLMQLADMFPDEESARTWFEDRIWPDGRVCPRCGSDKTVESKHPKMPYWCSEGRHYFSVKTGTVMEASKLPLRKWVYAIYLHLTSLKGVSSHKLSRDIGIGQESAWFMLQRIREAFDNNDGEQFGGPVEVDESYFGGREANKHQSKRLKQGGGTYGKVAVVAAKDRPTKRVKARVIKSADKATLHGFVEDTVARGAQLFTDEWPAYRGIRMRHTAVKHSDGQYVQGDAHTQGIESFWSMFKRGYVGTYHQMSPKHLHRYVREFAGRHNLRPLDTIEQMGELAKGMRGKRITYAALTA
ncbi:MAG: IS1595 family transposase [Chloroflexi bacterium]|nr:IS1595 family transposase [Chloroflexota bacterium]